MFGKKEIEILKQENEELKQKNEKLKENYGLSKSIELKNEIKVLNDEIESLKRLVDDKIVRIKELESKLEKEQNKNQDINIVLNDYRQKSLNLQKDKETLQNRYNELLDKYSFSNQDVEKLNKEIERLNQDISVKDKEIQAYIQAINNVSLTFQKSESQVKETKKESKGKE